MKQLKWDPILTGPKELSRAGEEQLSFGRERARIKLISSHFQEMYYSLTDEEPEQFENWFDILLAEVLSFGNAMCMFEETPSLIVMNVPFAIRRQLYENSKWVQTAIQAAQAADDSKFSFWSEFKNKEGISLAAKDQIFMKLWMWYFQVFEPIATRFTSIGSEHHNNNNLGK